MLAPKLRRSSASVFDKKDFEPSSLQDAINLLSYGCKVQKYNKSNGKPNQRIYYISEDDVDYLQYIPPSRAYNQCRICLLDIMELREIPTSETFEKLPFFRVLQITFSNKKHILLFEDSELRDLFWQGLQHFIELSEQNLNQHSHQIVLPIDENENQFTFSEFQQKLKKQRIHIKKNELLNHFKEYENNGVITLSGYQNILRILLNHCVIKDVFDKYQFNDLMGKQDFFNFLNNEQHQQGNDELYRQFATTKVNNLYFLSFQDFTIYMMSQRNCVFDYQKQQIYQSLDFPLTDYWINSSHNTYLMENQLTGESSIQAYVNAFQKGCRCVELDCWDGAEAPMIYHGYTMTSKITFESVIKTISEYGFKYSRFPLILSLEVHCSIKQQDIMAEILHDFLADRLLLLPQDYAQQSNFPTFRLLQEKIIIKHRGKLKSSLLFRNKYINQSPLLANPNEDFDQAIGYKQFETEQGYKSRKKTLIRQNNGLLIQRKIQINEIEQEAPPLKTIHKSITQTTLRPKYKLLEQDTQFQVIEPNPRVFQSMTPLRQESDDDENNDKKCPESMKMSALTALFGTPIKTQNRTVWEISSLEENKISDIYINFHRKYFTRIYPAGTRVDSSNYDPICAYNSGSQIVALNFQTNDMSMMLNTCKFLENGGLESGYILKPQWMRSDGFKTIKDFKIITLQFTLKIMIAYNLKVLDKKSIDPQIKVSIRGIPEDELSNKTKIAIVHLNGINHQYDFQESYIFRCPELAFLIFEINEGGKGFIGWSAIPVSCLVYGYRNIVLLNQYLKPIPNSGILIQIIKH